MTESRDLTFGERAVGLSFNPSGDQGVVTVKQMFATLIDLLNEQRDEATHDREKARLFSIAITEAQAAQMWAVKAITWRE
jgi:hypothetical protein